MWRGFYKLATDYTEYSLNEIQNEPTFKETNTNVVFVLKSYWHPRSVEFAPLFFLKVWILKLTSKTSLLSCHWVCVCSRLTVKEERRNSKGKFFVSSQVQFSFLFQALRERFKVHKRELILRLTLGSAVECIYSHESCYNLAIFLCHVRYVRAGHAY